MAFISKGGSIDWLCLPYFSSPSVFAALLDSSDGGSFSISPSSDFDVRREYRGVAPVLVSTFDTNRGRARLIDAMVLSEGASKLEPLSETVRIIEGISGQVHFNFSFIPRPNFALSKARFRRHGRNWVCSTGGNAFLLSSELPLSNPGDRLEGSFEVRAGERICFSLAFEKSAPLVFPPLGERAVERVQRTEDWWKEWAKSIVYKGPFRADVLRSAVTLKLLTFAPSGAVIAAASTSLPEVLGAGRNWDYRYCWLRDSALTMRAFLGLGLLKEAEAFLYWLLHATALTQPRLAVMYDVFGRSKLKERTLDHFSGYRDSLPVRIGNEAAKQVQLDVYGAVIAAADEFVTAGGKLQSDQKKLLCTFGSFVCAHWKSKDNSIWEIRGEKKHYTFSKVMCWVALDRLMKLQRENVIELDDSELFARERQAIRNLIEDQGYDDDRESYVGELNGSLPDASLLLMGCIGYCDPDCSRMRSTYDFIQRELGVSGMLYRYPPGSDGLDSLEGTFGVCSFWAIDNLAKRGDVAQAMESFESLLARGSDLGLYAEETDPGTGDMLGNFPQAFTHIGLINAALAIAEKLNNLEKADAPTA